MNSDPSSPPQPTTPNLTGLRATQQTKYSNFTFEEFERADLKNMPPDELRAFVATLRARTTCQQTRNAAIKKESRKMSGKMSASDKFSLEGLI